jgi:hypothetical protein
VRYSSYECYLKYRESSADCTGRVHPHQTTDTRDDFPPFSMTILLCSLSTYPLDTRNLFGTIVRRIDIICLESFP